MSESFDPKAIDPQRACRNCGRQGALPNGLCLRCAVKLLPKTRPTRRRQPVKATRPEPAGLFDR